MESNLNCLVSQPNKNRPLRGYEVTGGKYRSAKPMKVYPASRVLIFSKRQVEKKLIEMTIEPVEVSISIHLTLKHLQRLTYVM